MGSSLMNHCEICAGINVRSAHPCHQLLVSLRWILPGCPPSPSAGSRTGPVKFVSDGNNAGCGFELTFTAVHKDSEAGDLTDAVETPFFSLPTPLK